MIVSVFLTPTYKSTFHFTCTCQNARCTSHCEMSVLSTLACLFVTLLSPRSWRCLLDFWKICGPFLIPSTKFFAVQDFPVKTNFEAPHCVVTSSLPLHPPSSLVRFLENLWTLPYTVDRIFCSSGFSGENKFRSSSLCSFLQSSVTPSVVTC
jgi:hypothetical protein